MVVFSVFYPAHPGSRMDWDYYHATHVPLVKAAFAGTGLTDIQVLQGLPSPDGGPAPYVLIANLIFESPEALQACLTSPRTPEVLADIANFTDITPITQISASKP
jgi:uncharacterized protein (TIGR02118 family)